ncbi:MAG: hypothetical protein GX758_03715 [Tenericutes bacterium]|nr:hypothetical protein [Mycoplasmatota bacterium]
MEKEYETIKLNNTTFLIVDELIEDNQKYLYLISEDENELQIVKETVTEKGTLVETVKDANELEKISYLFAKRIMSE